MITLLLVDDDMADLAALSAALLEYDDVEVRTAFDGDEAARRAAADPPDLVVLDLSMPRMGGIAALGQLKLNERTEHIPIIVLTSSDAADHIDRAYRNRCAAYLVKPTTEGWEPTARAIHAFWIDRNRYARPRATEETP